VCRAVAEICRTLDGMPLALELAAARIRHLPIGALASRVEHHLEMLGRGRPDMPARHQTLRATIDASYELLEPDHRTVFDQLGVFVGGFALDAAESVCGDGVEVVEALSSLIDNSLVRFDTRMAEGRYTMLHVISEYALEHLVGRPDAAAVEARFVAFYLQLAESLAPSLPLGVTRPAAIERLLAESGNLRAVLNRSQELGDGDLLLRMVSALGAHWLPRLYRDEALGWAEAGLALAPDAAPSLRAAALTVRAAAQNGTAEGDRRAYADLLKAFDLCQASDDPALEFIVASGLGVTSTRLRDVTSAARWHALALDTARRIGDETRISLALTNLCDGALVRGDLAAARRLAEESLELLGASSDRECASLAHINLASVLVLQEAPRDAAAHALESIHLAQTVHDPELMAWIVSLIAAIGLGCGAAEMAARLLAAADAIRAAHGVEFAGFEAMRFEHTRDTLAQQLGDAALERAWQEGLAVSPGEAFEAAKELAQACAGASTGDSA
jgi:hypothetical protein